jgi:hypothetical protein
VRTVTITVGDQTFKVACDKRDKIGITVKGKTRLDVKQTALNFIELSQKKAKGL